MQTLNWNKYVDQKSQKSSSAYMLQARDFVLKPKGPVLKEKKKSLIFQAIKCILHVVIGGPVVPQNNLYIHWL